MNLPPGCKGAEAAANPTYKAEVLQGESMRNLSKASSGPHEGAPRPKGLSGEDTKSFPTAPQAFL